MNQPDECWGTEVFEAHTAQQLEVEYLRNRVDILEEQLAIERAERKLIEAALNNVTAGLLEAET